MKKQKWLVLFVLVLSLVSSIKASNYVMLQKQKAGAVIKTQPVNASATLIEQILFPHGI